MHAAAPSKAPPAASTSGWRALALAVGLVLLALTTCAYLAFVHVSTPTLTVVEVRVQGVRRDGLTIAVDAAIDNRNRFDVTVQSVDVEATLEGHSMGHPRVLASPLTLAAGRATTVTLEIDTPWGEALSIAWRAADTERFHYRADGTVRVGGERLHVNVPIHVTGEILRSTVLDVLRNSIRGQSIDLPGGWTIDLP